MRQRSLDGRSFSPSEHRLAFLSYGRGCRQRTVSAQPPIDRASIWHMQIPDDPCLSQDVKDPGIEIRLPPAHCVPIGARKGVVVVLQAVTESKDGNRPVIRAIVSGDEGSRTDHVTARPD